MTEKEVGTKLDEALEKSGLPSRPGDCEFTFYADYGSHFGIINGTIIGMGLSDESGFELYVSVPRFACQKLISLKYDDNEKVWCAYVEAEELNNRFYQGILAVQWDS